MVLRAPLIISREFGPNVGFARGKPVWSKASHRESRHWSNIMKNLFARFVKDQSGATAIEYGLIASLIGVAIIGALRSTGSKLANTFTNVQNVL